MGVGITGSFVGASLLAVSLMETSNPENPTISPKQDALVSGLILAGSIAGAAAGGLLAMSGRNARVREAGNRPPANEQATGSPPPSPVNRIGDTEMQIV